MRRPWWLFYGVARETERMRYRGPWERFTLAFQEGLMPVFRQLQQTFKEVGRAFASSGVSVSSAHSVSGIMRSPVRKA